MVEHITRKATLDDIPWILEECVKFCKLVNVFKDWHSDAYIKETLAGLIKTQVVLVVESDKEPSGFIIATYCPYFLNPDLITLNEVIWWVKETHRLTRAGSKLMEEFCKIAEETADFCEISIWNSSSIQDETILKQGFEPGYRSFTKRCKNVR